MINAIWLLIIPTSWSPPTKSKREGNLFEIYLEQERPATSQIQDKFYAQLISCSFKYDISQLNGVEYELIGL